MDIPESRLELGIILQVVRPQSNLIKIYRFTSYWVILRHFCFYKVTFANA